MSPVPRLQGLPFSVLLLQVSLLSFTLSPGRSLAGPHIPSQGSGSCSHLRELPSLVSHHSSSSLGLATPCLPDSKPCSRVWSLAASAV